MQQTMTADASPATLEAMAAGNATNDDGGRPATLEAMAKQSTGTAARNATNDDGRHQRDAVRIIVDTTAVVYMNSDSYNVRYGSRRFGTGQFDGMDQHRHK